MPTVAQRLADLYGALDSMAQVAVAVSGGVDSMTLACAAHRRLGDRATMFHAVSPAVPPEATERTRRHAARLGWRLEVIEAGEFADPDYVRNPVNRCFFCKSNLYASIARHSDVTIVSGTNLDDLADFRPGLEAARNHRVRHPFVEVHIDKSTVRAIARSFDLEDVAELPASPCLSSRVETGLRVTPESLRLVHAVERLVRDRVEATSVRCRIRREGLVIELDDAAIERLTIDRRNELGAEIERVAAVHGPPPPVRFARYRMGSAFLRE